MLLRTRKLTLRTNAFLVFCLLSSSGWAQSASSKGSGSPDEVSTEVKISDKAREQFRAGVSFMQDPDGARYAEALQAFKAAYAESPSWKILGNLGIAAMKLERDGEAIEALQTYLTEGGANIDPGERKQVQSDLDTLKATVTWVTLSSTVPGAQLLDERTPLAGGTKRNLYGALNEPMRVGLHGGRHKMTLELEGYETATWSFDADGKELTHEFQLVQIQSAAPTTPSVTEEPKETHRPVPTPVWITLGATGAFGAGAAVTGILALGKSGKYEDQNDGTDPEGAEDLRKSAKTLNITTDVLLGAAVVSAGVTAYLYFTRPEVDVARDTGFAFVPTVSPQGGGFTLLGNF